MPAAAQTAVNLEKATTRQCNPCRCDGFLNKARPRKLDEG
jgi:hypothetical protein